MVLLVAPKAASATWSATASGGAPVVASTMTNATGFKAACTSTGGNSSVTLTWTISPDPFVDGYEIVRTATGGGTNRTIRVGRTTATYVDDTTTKPTGNTGPHVYSYTIRSGSTAHAWTTPLLAAVGTPTYTNNSCS